MKNFNQNPDNREQAFKLFWKKIYLTIKKITNNEKEAEDIAMNSFDRLLSREDIDSMSLSHIEGFLIKTAKNKTADYYRRKKSWKNFLKSHEARGPEFYEEEWYIEDLLAEHIAVVKEVIDELSDRRREVLKLRYYEGMSALEISENLKISVNTVNNTLAEGKESIRIKLLQRRIKL